MKLPIKFNTKDSITVFIVAFLLLAIPLTVITVINQRDQRSKAALTANFTLSPSTTTINQNTQFTVDIKLDSTIDQVKAGNVVLSYPTAMLDIVPDAANGNLFTSNGSNFTLAPLPAPAGTIGIMFIRTAAPFPSGANQQIARITFKSKLAVGAAAVNFSSFVGVNGGTFTTEAINTANVNLSVLSSNGSYTVVDPLPTVSITAPTAIPGVVKGTVAVDASATDNNSVARVDFYVDNVLKTGDTVAPYSYPWNTTLETNASHTLKAIAVDSGGNSSPQSTVSVVVDNAKPTVTLTAPIASATPYSGSVIVTATAADNRALANVAFYVDGGPTPVSTINAPGPYTFNWNTTTVSNTAHTLTAKAIDTVVGNVSTIASVTITVDNQAPTVPVLTATPFSDTQINLSWTASTDTQSSVTYEVYRNGVKVNPTPPPLTATTFSDTGLIASTTYNYYIQVKDLAGNTINSTTVPATTKPIPRLGDVTGDGRVNILDVSRLIDKWGATTKPIEDINQDGRVDILDISILIDNWY